MEIARSLYSFASPANADREHQLLLHILGKLRQPCNQYTNRQHTMIGEVIKPQSDKIEYRRTLSRRARIPQRQKVRVRRMPEVHLMGRYLSLCGTDVDRNEPVQKDGHGAFRSAKRLVAFCHFPALSDLVEFVVSRGYRVITFDDSDSFRETCDCLATADHGHIVHPLQRQCQLPTVMQ